jgi:hypothetical protein
MNTKTKDCIDIDDEYRCPDCGGSLDENNECPGWYSKENYPLFEDDADWEIIKNGIHL